MKVVLATGIYPPDIGGPATYVLNLAKELVSEGVEVVVVTYASNDQVPMTNDQFVVRVSRSLPIVRWFQYARALKKYGADADVVYAFSSVSCGIPVWLAHLKKPKKILRLGGDFLWERYTALGGRKSLREYYRLLVTRLLVTRLMQWLLNRFDHIVFSTRFQEEIYEKHYKKLPKHSVLENAVPVFNILPSEHRTHDPFKLLFVGRFVGFKNLLALVEAMADLPNVLLTLIGEGPMEDRLHQLVENLGLQQRVLFVGPVHGKHKQDIFGSHDLMIIPSLTEISSNTALEAVGLGLPVLITEESGLSDMLSTGMLCKPLQSSHQMVQAIQKVIEAPLKKGQHEIPSRTWSSVSEEHLSLFQGLL